MRRHPLLALVLLGFALRLAFYWHWQGPPAALQDDYFQRAVKMLNGESLTLLEDIFRPPLYAWFLWLLFKVTGVSIKAAAVLQCAIGAATGWMLYRMAKLWGDEKAGIAAAGLWSVNVYSVYYSARLMNETLYVALTVAFFWLWLEATPLPLGEGRVRATLLAGLAGLAAGLACLCKWSFMAFLPLFAVVEALPALKERRRLIPLALCLLVAAAAIGLWGLRNQRTHGRFILAGPQKGWNFYEGLALQTSEDLERPQQMAAEAAALGLDKDLFKQDAYFWDKGWKEVREDPWAGALLFAGKAVKFWRLAPYPPHPRLLRWGAGLFYLLLFASAVQGGLMAHRRGIRLLPFLALIGYTWLLHTVFFSGIRYRFPLDPFLTLLAGISLAELLWGDGRPEKL